MAATSVLVPIFVAVIGVIGTLTPLYINSSVSSSPKIIIRSDPVNSNVNESHILIQNNGTVAATNMSVFVNACQTNSSTPANCQFKIHSITNGYSTADVLVPPNDVPLEPGSSQKFNRSLAEVHVPKLVQGSASFINLYVAYDNSSGQLGRRAVSPSEFDVYAIFDQGSASSADTPKTWQEELLPFFNPSIDSPYYIYILILYLTLSGFTGWYISVRRGRKHFISSVIDKIDEVRRQLRGDHTYTGHLYEDFYWRDESPNGRQR